ncbi:MAG: hypothetical protein KDC98_17580 [Planctomycetes bacterium]|nr:hypothetical protein [Planctomycetota bacterium]
MNASFAASGLLFVLVAACASPAPTERKRVEIEEAFQRMQNCQLVFREQNTVPQTFDFEDQGRVTVHEISLDGYPGYSYLRCRFRYQNRTDEPVVQSWVALDVLDADGQLVASETANCMIPHPMGIARGSFVSDELRTRTFGAHLQPGWSWRIRCVAQHQDYEPMDPPVERPPLLPPPVIIKNRGQNDFVSGSDGYRRDRSGVRMVGGAAAYPR